MTVVEGNASAYQGYPVSRINGEGRAEFKGRGGMGLNTRERDQGGTGEATQSVRGNYESFKGINLTLLGTVHQCTMYIL